MPDSSLFTAVQNTDGIFPKPSESHSTQQQSISNTDVQQKMEGNTELLQHHYN
jgi:hypothetical protein